ncbi:MAG: 5-formyltetrahydrofolate cyclo-ligase [Chryseolinea sp.]
MNKEGFRTLYLKRRLALSEQTCSLLSHTMQERFAANFDPSRLKVLHCYLPIAKNKEPDTWIIIDWLRMKFPDLRISLPRINYMTEEIESIYFDDRYQLKKNKWGVDEPDLGEATRHEDIDMVIVPLLVVDKYGNRVGYGKGYYDKFLAKCRPDCVKVGLSFFEPVDTIDAISPSDIPVHYSVTPLEVHKF